MLWKIGSSQLATWLSDLADRHQRVGPVFLSHPDLDLKYFRNAGFPDFRKSGFPEIRKFAIPEI